MPLAGGGEHDAAVPAVRGGGGSRQEPVHPLPHTPGIETVSTSQS